MKRLIIAAFLFPLSVSAVDIESEEVLHFAAHFGISYAITHGTYAVCKALTDSQTPCIITGIAAAVAAGATKEIIDNKTGPSNKNILKGMGENALGISGAVLMIKVSF